jgi:hypothetical protein
MSRKLSVCLAFLVCLFSAWSQVAGRISGSVVDPSGASVAGASVELRLANSETIVARAKVAADGGFSFVAVRPETYDITVEAPGFSKTITRGVVVNPIQETSVPVIKLEVSSTNSVVEVTVSSLPLQTTSVEVSKTITRTQVENLPVANRQLTNLLTLEAGVSDGRGPTVINGTRTSSSSVTIDGINIQDNFIRTNSLSFLPFRPTIDQISEITIATSNLEASAGGGAAQISMSTRGGTNDFHGSVYWFNRNSRFGANDWFNNRVGGRRPFINQNQPGWSLGGPIKRNKLFFFVNQEIFRLRSQSSQLRTVLTPAARAGNFNYLVGGAPAAAVNVLQRRNDPADPLMTSLLQDLPLPNTTEVGDGRNTSGYRFNAGNNQNRDQWVGRGDYVLNDKNSFYSSYNYTKENNQRPDVTTLFYTTGAPVSDTGRNNLFSAAWRFSPTAKLTNEVRGGFALAQPRFTRNIDTPDRFIAPTLITSPQATFLPQGRDTRTWQLQNNSTYVTGRHQIQFGYQYQNLNVQPFNDAGIIPTYTLGISAAATGLTVADLPGVSANDLAIANNLYALLAGRVSQVSQSFNVKDRTSGFVSGQTNRREWRYGTHAGYVSDRFRVNRKLTAVIGLRYEFWTPVTEGGGLALLPELQNNNVIATLLSPNQVLNFAGSGTNRSFYNADRNNFAPNIGLAWDPAGDGKTVIRAGYSLGYINDETIVSVQNNVSTASGLNQAVTSTNQNYKISNAPAVTAPTFTAPRTLAANYALNSQTASGMPDTNLQTPYVQQWNLSVGRDLKGNVFEVRYLGNRSTQLFRAIDFNQVDIRRNGFLADFNRARNNAVLSQAVNGTFNGTYNPAIAGSQPLTVFPNLAGGGTLTSAANQSLLLNGEAGQMAANYQINRQNGSVNFFTNPNGLGMNLLTNVAHANYHALQVDYRRAMANGLQFNANYTWSKSLSNSAGDGQARFEPFLDLATPSVEYARTPFDLRHAFKFNYVYELPFGAGKRWSGNGFLNTIFGGWSTSGNYFLQSGFPFSIVSQFGTLNRGGGRSDFNTATTASNYDQINANLGLVFDGRGVGFVNQRILGTDNRGTAAVGTPNTNQIFVNPSAGQLGTLQRRMFSGPIGQQWNASLGKTFTLFGEKAHKLRFAADAFNATNSPIFFIAEQQGINSVNFGRITSTDNSPRIMQFSLYYRF